MEIFKAAANQAMSANINPSQQNQIETRQIEHTDIEENVTANKKSKLEDALDKELDGLSNEELAKRTKEVTDKLNFQMEQLDTNVRFAYNDTLNLMVVQVKDAKTGDLVTQLPSKQAIKISEYFKESIGILFDKES
ncbi:FlaG family protein [Campylobacter curvus]|mgnify:FL=1|uniref:Flagellar protein FlaG n=1 Tax=Campylobacter curvus (strain 525.92) TaxID=360105 RepID=A7GYT3_CAMC5|nr:FlaG family protein [Campylobacter curvus]EAT99964.1 flagellar protein FlaG [Campylobacter curvus 525.92]QKF61366.1 flagellar protein FlaG [Campylobacter curvus]UEB49679.1 flagellar protein FlaG [Campylobacter curvus]